jgi:hypothetical protein
MLDRLLRRPDASRPDVDPRVAAALAQAAAAIARLDQALALHPLRPAFLHRARLDAVRRQADADGQRIDPWHLAALIEGLRLRMDPALRIVERGDIFAAARYALELHQWLTTPDFDQEGDVQQAEKALAAAVPGTTPLLAAAHGMHAWLDAGGTRPPIRAALIRFWARQKLLRTPVPLTGAVALRADMPADRVGWTAAFLTALAGEAEDALQLLLDLERAWFAARAAVAGRRRHSRAAVAVDILAAAPLVSATSLAAGLGMAVNNAAALLDAFCAAGIAVEVTHRSKRRLFGLAALAPLRKHVAPPDHPEPGRGRGRPPAIPEADLVTEPPPPLSPLTPIERRAFDYSDIEHWMAHLDQTIRQTRRVLQTLAGPTIEPAPPDPQSGVIVPAADVPEPGHADDRMEHDV